jgi:phenylacetate-CoA ligase
MTIKSDVQRMNQSEIEKMQLEMLKKQLLYVYNNSKFYKTKFSGAGIKPSDIKKLDDFRKIPFSTKEELRKDNWDFVCTPMKDIVDVGTTTGTSGIPIMLPVTHKDWNNLVLLIKSALVEFVGVTKKDVVQLMLAFDQLFSVSTPADDALKRIGATSVRTGPGNTIRQIELMKRLKTTVIYATPDYMLTLAEKAREMGYEPSKDFDLKKVVLIGQPLYKAGWKPTELKKLIEEIWDVETFSSYGSMEMLAGFYECPSHAGHHTFPDYLYLEIIDPCSGEVLGPAEEGEIVVTHLKMEGIPLVRYRQGDLTSMESTNCSCGETSPRVMAIIGRTDNMLKIKGTSVSPQQIEDIIVSLPQITNYIIEAFKDQGGNDAVKIKVSLKNQDKKFLSELKNLMKAKIRITPEIEIIDSKTISDQVFKQGTRKPKKFWDKRNT